MNRRELARAITLVESARAEDQAQAWQLLQPLAEAPPTARRIALSGVPGVGKSTFIEALGTTLADDGHRVAVLAVDPSSPFSGGSILGDKTRMQRLSAHPNAFIRPSPTGGTLGGVARRTYESMLLCEAAGYDVILVETVGVGQSEFEAATLCDLFCLLLLPGAGDGLQGIKRGILECADLFVVNKADSGQEDRAAAARAELEAALHLTARAEPAPVRAASALTGAGLAGVWTDLDLLWSTRRHDGRLGARRADQHRAWLRRRLEELVVARFWHEHPALPSSAADLAARIRALLPTPE